MFTEYITRRLKGEFAVDRYGENEATYLGMDISKVHKEDPDGAILNSGKYEVEINHIEIRTHSGDRRTIGGSGESDFAAGIWKIDLGCANCATGRDILRIGRRTDVSGWGIN